MTTTHTPGPTPAEILTWQERYKEERTYWGAHDEKPYMEAEIADLRAALAARVAPPEQSAMLKYSVLRDSMIAVSELAQRILQDKRVNAPTVRTQFKRIFNECVSAISKANAIPIPATATVPTTSGTPVPRVGGGAETGCIKCPRDPLKVCDYCGTIGPGISTTPPTK